MLVIDNRPDPGAGPAPGFHALIIGISAYPNLKGGQAALADLGLEQLAAPAITAYRIYRWLVQNVAGLPIPLHTVRLLLVPSAVETAKEPGFAEAFAAGASNSASYADVQTAVNDWREDVAKHRDSVALFFFSGHGLGGTGDDALMLVGDFGEPGVPLLQRAISITDLEQGMAPPVPGGARTIGRKQIYIVDACRNRPPGLPRPDSAEVPTIWKAPIVSGVDDRELSILLATINDRRAYTGKPGELTVFGQALLDCLEGAAAEAVQAGDSVHWAVTTADVTKYLPIRINERIQKLKVSQAFRPGRQNSSVLLVTFAQPPTVVVVFPVVGTTPAGNLQLQLAYGFDMQKIGPLELPPREYKLPMGWYAIATSAITPPPQGNKQIQKILRPPRHAIDVDF